MNVAYYVALDVQPTQFGLRANERSILRCSGCPSNSIWFAFKSTQHAALRWMSRELHLACWAYMCFVGPPWPHIFSLGDQSQLSCVLGMLLQQTLVVVQTASRIFLATSLSTSSNLCNHIQTRQLAAVLLVYYSSDIQERLLRVEEDIVSYFVPGMLPLSVLHQNLHCI